jgi:hypothetical protein
VSRRATDDAWFPAACVLAGYVVIAQGVGNLYPFSTFEMYAGVSTHTASRVLALDAAGATHEIRDFEAYRCDTLDLQPAACRERGDYYSIGYVEREAAEYLAAQASVPPRGDELPIRLVRRIWRFHGTGEPAVEDCALASCEAVRR